MIKIQDGNIGYKMNQRLREAIADLADTYHDLVRPHPAESGSRAWLCLDRVREGYAKKLVHLWHELFRLAEMIGEYAVKLDIARSTYSIFPKYKSRTSNWSRYSKIDR
ncbi:hypothetical protein PHMEG_00028687 [Phytophthora megakarya]|uniref:Reverse transcriptase n=1 Tax=Phytophthora megakarya TaxID=4795 RepID=A0A225V507_9STRA|nr:hypothetical protein PHMEG_00028687 [Phytophthora megakarya]